MSKWTNVRKFDFAKGEYTNSYYKMNEFDYFVDSEFGSDTNDGLTPQTAFKTLDKIVALNLSDGKIAIYGYFVLNTNFTILDNTLKLVGCGGYNGRTIITANHSVVLSVLQMQNIFIKTDAKLITIIRRSTPPILQNCIVINAQMGSWGYKNELYAYNSFLSVYTYGTKLYLTKTTFNLVGVVDAYPTGQSLNFTHSINYTLSNAGIKNLINTNSRYFTDNTETTPADLYIDSANGNYEIVPTFSTPIWDKQTQQYITANPLYNEGNTIGVGVETLALTALDDSLKSTDNGGDATYTNMDNPINSVVCRIDDSIDGTLVSGVQDLGRVMNGVKIDAIATYDTNGGLITKRLQQSTPSIEQTTDFGIQFGETQQECEDMTPILCEYGKVVTYSKNGNIMYGNSDLNFQPNKKKVAKFRYFIISIRAKTIS